MWNHDEVKPNMKTIEYFEGNTLLHGATQQRMDRYVRLLVKHGFDLRRKSVTNDQGSYNLSLRFPSKTREYYDSILVELNLFILCSVFVSRSFFTVHCLIYYGCCSIVFDCCTV